MEKSAGKVRKHKRIRVNYQSMLVESLKFQWYYERCYMGKPHNNLVVKKKKKTLEKRKL